MIPLILAGACFLAAYLLYRGDDDPPGPPNSTTFDDMAWHGPH
jgi:hypothetical protein